CAAWVPWTQVILERPQSYGAPADLSKARKPVGYITEVDIHAENALVCIAGVVTATQRFVRATQVVVHAQQLELVVEFHRQCTAQHLLGDVELLLLQEAVAELFIN